MSQLNNHNKYYIIISAPKKAHINIVSFYSVSFVASNIWQLCKNHILLERKPSMLQASNYNEACLTQRIYSPELKTQQILCPNPILQAKGRK